MIIQGQNTPIVLELEEHYIDISDLSISLISKATGALLKHWGLSDVTISDGLIELPLTQKDTLAWPSGTVIIEVKYAQMGYVQLCQPILDNITGRHDMTILGGTYED